MDPAQVPNMINTTFEEDQALCQKKKKRINPKEA